MPFVGKTINKKPYLFGSIVIVTAFAGEVALHQLVPTYKDNCYLQALFNCLAQTPTMILGYVFARIRLFQKVPIVDLRGTGSKVLVALDIVVIMFVILFIRSKIGVIVGFNLDFFYAPLILSFQSVSDAEAQQGYDFVR